MAINMCIIGFGGMAGWHLQNVDENVPEVNITGVYDIREEALEKAKRKRLKVYKSKEEIYADKNIDLILIATPNDVHKSYSIESLEAGKNVICEKPVTMNLAELDEIIKVAEKTKKFFTVHQNRRWDKDYLTVRKIIKDGFLQGLYRIESRVQGSRQWVHGWRGYKINGGGMLLDWGVHLIDQILCLFDEKIISISANEHRVMMSEVEDDFTATLQFESGLTAIVNVSMSAFIPQKRWHLFCKNGAATVLDWDANGEIVRLKNSETLSWEEDIVYTSAGPTRSMAPRPDTTVEKLPLPVVEGDWLDLYRNAVQVINGREQSVVTYPQMRRCMEVIDAIFLSFKNKASVQCSI